MLEVVFYRDKRGAEPVRDYIDNLPRRADRATVLRYVVLLADQGHTLLAKGHARMIDRTSRIYELRPGAYRVAYAEHAGGFVLLHARRKQGQKLDSQALDLARGRLNEWRERHGSDP